MPRARCRQRREVLAEHDCRLREARKHAIGNHGVRVVPSACNFLLLIFEGAVSAEDVYKGLMERGYITRWLPGQGLAQGLRVTIGTEEETRGVAAAIRDIVAGN